MFLWADVAWKHFKRGLLWNVDTIDKKLHLLDNIPPGLDSLYGSLLAEIDEEIRDDMWVIFLVILTAKESLKPEELGILVAMNDTARRFLLSTDVAAFANLERIIDANFPNMVTIEDDGRVRFYHLSFKEYLDHHLMETDTGLLSRSYRLTTKSCLTYLDFPDVMRKHTE